MQRLQNGLDGLRIPSGELFGERTHFFGMVGPHLLRRHHGESDAVDDGPVVPWLAHAETVHLVHLHVGNHLRRRDGDERDILVGMNPAGSEPVAHPHRVGAWRKRHGKRQRMTGGFGLVGERFEILRCFHARLLQLVVQRDRLTVAIQQPGNHHRFHRRARQTHGGRERHAKQHVRRLVFADRQLVANHRPRGLFRDDGLDPELLEVVPARAPSRSTNNPSAR